MTIRHVSWLDTGNKGRGGNLQPSVAEMKMEIPHGEAGEGLERISFHTNFWIQNYQTLSFSVF